MKRVLFCTILLILPGFDAVAGAGDRTMDYTWLLFLEVNAPPQVNAGADLQITSNRANLNGAVNDDPRDTLAYAWTKVSGPGSVAFSSSSAEDTSATFSSSGIYVLQLSASDGELTSSDQVIITVTNTAPLVNAGANKQITHPTNSVSLNATVSDAQNNIQTYAWSKITGPGSVAFGSPSAEDTTAVFSVAGTYTLRLRASDWEFATTDTVIIEYDPAPANRKDYIVAVGDSITDGFGDSNCVFQQAKTTCSGYTPKLESLLEAARGYNHTIIDEGYGGATSYDGLYGVPSKSRPSIDAVISRYPSADQYLVMFGTNDANQDPPVSSSAFKSHMELIARKIILAGKEPALAKIPYAKDEKAYLNTTIQLYNNKVAELVNEKASIIVSPPNFYAWFQGHQGQIHDTHMFTGDPDNLHPTHDGYWSMARQWHDQLIQ